jgi:hypothetical protein
MLTHADIKTIMKMIKRSFSYDEEDSPDEAITKVLSSKVEELIPTE